MTRQTAKEFTEWLEAFKWFATYLSTSNALPKELKDPGQVIMVLQAANDLNMTPTEAFQSLAMINWRISMRGAKVIERLYAKWYTPKFEENFTMIEKRYKWNDGKEFTKKVPEGTCTAIILKGEDEVGRETFTTEDAKTAWLLEKDNRTKYPKTMLRYRAMRLAITFRAPDVLGGIQVAEEMQDVDGAWYEKVTDETIIEWFLVEWETQTAPDQVWDTDTTIEQERTKVIKWDSVEHKLLWKGVIEDIDGDTALVNFGEKVGLKPMKVDFLKLTR